MTRADFGAAPDTLDAEEIGSLLHRVSEIERWCNDLRQTALDRAYSGGEHLPGWKVVRSGGRRVVTDAPAAIQRLIDFGLEAEEVADFKIKGITALEKMVRARHTEHESPPSLEDVIGDLIQRTEGKPALAREDDKRPSIDPYSDAAKDFE